MAVRISDIYWTKVQWADAKRSAPGSTLLAPRNATVITALIISALSVSGAMFLILEIYQPLDGMIKVSNAPLPKALELLGRNETRSSC